MYMATKRRALGDIVRIAPNDLSFITPQAFRDIYGHPLKGRKLFPKPEIFWKTFNAPGMLFIMDPEEAASTRDLLSPGFSPKALRNQESVIQNYTDQLVATITRLSVEEEKTVNISDAFNWVTFDILGVWSLSSLLYLKANTFEQVNLHLANLSKLLKMRRRTSGQAQVPF